MNIMGLHNIRPRGGFALASIGLSALALAAVLSCRRWRRARGRLPTGGIRSSIFSA